VDGDILFGLLKKVAPNVYKHLVSIYYILGIDFFTLSVILYFTNR